MTVTVARVTRPRVPYPEASRALLRDTVLDAMRDLLGTKDWSAITLADVEQAYAMLEASLVRWLDFLEAAVFIIVARDLKYQLAADPWRQVDWLKNTDSARKRYVGLARNRVASSVWNDDDAPE